MLTLARVIKTPESAKPVEVQNASSSDTPKASNFCNLLDLQLDKPQSKEEREKPVKTSSDSSEQQPQTDPALLAWLKMMAIATLPPAQSVPPNMIEGRAESGDSLLPLEAQVAPSLSLLPNVTTEKSQGAISLNGWIAVSPQALPFAMKSEIGGQNTQQRPEQALPQEPLLNLTPLASPFSQEDAIGVSTMKSPLQEIGRAHV